jgi:hypothetical protein
LQTLQAAAITHAAVAQERTRGEDSTVHGENDDVLEKFVADAATREFLEAHGLAAPVDEALAEEALAAPVDDAPTEPQSM